MYGQVYGTVSISQSQLVPILVPRAASHTAETALASSTRLHSHFSSNVWSCNSTASSPSLDHLAPLHRRYVGRALGVQDSFDPDVAYLSSVRIDADEEESQAIEKDTSFTSVDKQNWNDSQFMSHMFGYKRSKSYTQAQMEGAIRAPAEINPEILSAKGIKEITPKEAEAAGVPRCVCHPDDDMIPPHLSLHPVSFSVVPTVENSHLLDGSLRYIFRKIDTNHDGKVSVQELRKASLDGLLTIQELEAEAAAAAAGPQAGPAESQGRRRESARGSRKWSTTSNVAVGITIEPEASAGPAVGEPGTPFRVRSLVQPRPITVWRGCVPPVRFS